jgi:hypothetical protein
VPASPRVEGSRRVDSSNRDCLMHLNSTGRNCQQVTGPALHLARDLPSPRTGNNIDDKNEKDSKASPRSTPLPAC